MNFNGILKHFDGWELHWVRRFGSTLVQWYKPMSDMYPHHYLIDEMQMFNRELSDAEINSIFYHDTHWIERDIDEMD